MRSGGAEPKNVYHWLTKFGRDVLSVLLVDMLLRDMTASLSGSQLTLFRSRIATLHPKRANASDFGGGSQRGIATCHI